MSDDRNKAIARRIFEEMYTNKDPTLVDALYHEEYVARRSAGDLTGRDSMHAALANLRESWPDLTFAVDELIAEGDMVVARWHSEGTHRGPYLGVAATGRRTTNTGISTFRIRDGKIVESWSEMDTLGILRQLGAAPAGT
jgi:steroid delta-isomerase-like uncharacterized protein